jgi:L-serine deaminase
MENSQLYSPDMKFDTQVSYTNMLMQRINEIQFSMRFGKDCTREFFNIMDLLTDGIKKPIEKDIKQISSRYEERANEIRNMTTFPESTFKWSGRHKERYRGILLKNIQTEAMHEMISVLINQLDKMGLLLHRNKQAQI